MANGIARFSLRTSSSNFASDLLQSLVGLRGRLQSLGRRQRPIDALPSCLRCNYACVVI